MTKIQAGPDEKLYSVTKVAAMVDQLRVEGISPEQALDSTGLAEGDLVSTETRVSLNQVLRCYRNAVRLSADPYFSWHTGLRLHVPTFGMFGFAILSSTNYRKTVRFMMAYRQLVAVTAEVSFAEVDGRGIWTIVPAAHPNVDAAMFRFLVELQFGILTAVHRDIMGRSFAPSTLRVTYDPGAVTPTLSETAGCAVEFGQAANEFIFDAGWMNATLELGNDITYQILVGVCDQLMAELRVRVGFAGQVRTILLPGLTRPVSFDTVAERLNMTARTLRRRLREENTSFRALLDELRMEVAIKYLRETHLTIEDIAYALGFSEASNFRHAFRRWTQTVPDEFRRVARPWREN